MYKAEIERGTLQYRRLTNWTSASSNNTELERVENPSSTLRAQVRE